MVGAICGGAEEGDRQEGCRNAADAVDFLRVYVPGSAECARALVGSERASEGSGAPTVSKNSG